VFTFSPHLVKNVENVTEAIAEVRYSKLIANGGTYTEYFMHQGKKEKRKKKKKKPRAVKVGVT
jgi:hypothetical protein